MDKTIDTMFKIFSTIFAVIFVVHIFFVPAYILGSVGACELGMIELEELCARMGYSVIMAISGTVSLLLARALR